MVPLLQFSTMNQEEKKENKEEEEKERSKVEEKEDEPLLNPNSRFAADHNDQISRSKKHFPF